MGLPPSSDDVTVIDSDDDFDVISSPKNHKVSIFSNNELHDLATEETKRMKTVADVFAKPTFSVQKNKNLCTFSSENELPAKKNQSHVENSNNVFQKHTQPIAKSLSVENAHHPISVGYGKSNHNLNIEGVNVLFPFQPYQSQIEMMRNIIKTLNSGAGNHVLVESPTGTGKTMTLICSVLAWHKNLSQTSTSNSQNGAKKMPKEETDKFDDDSFDEVKLPTVYYTSRTHKQLSQAISELRKSPYTSSNAVLASRSKTCLNSRVNSEADINQACFDALKANAVSQQAANANKPGSKHKGCSYFHRAQKLSNHFKNQTHDLEDLLGMGEELHACPYFAIRELIITSKLVFAPYNYLIDPIIRESCGINLENAIIIIDEAHNVEDVSRSSGNGTVSKDNLIAIEAELVKLVHGSDGGAQKVFDSSGIVTAPFSATYLKEHATILSTVKLLLSLMTSVKVFDVVEFEKKYKVFNGKDIIDALNTFALNKQTFGEFLKSLAKIEEAHRETDKEKTENAPKENEEATPIVLSIGSCRMLARLAVAMEHIFDQNVSHADDYTMIISCTTRAPMGRSFADGAHKKKQNRSDEDYLMFDLTFCLQNPGVTFMQLSKVCRNVILTSGSLSPLQSFQSELMTRFSHVLEAPHVISDCQVWAGVISHSPSGTLFNGTFKVTETLEYQDGIGESVVEILERSPAGTLCFFPSFSFLDKLVSRWMSTGVYAKVSALKSIYCEPKDSNDFENILDAYYASVDSGSGAILFAVYRGKASEGLNFTDNYARTVIVVGIPYPNFKDIQVAQKRQFNDRFLHDRNLISGSEWYEIQAFRALNQALGRCIRHKDDWGAIVLMDCRFGNANVRKFISKWIRDKIRLFPGKCFTQAMGSLEMFFRNKAK